MNRPGYSILALFAAIVALSSCGVSEELDTKALNKNYFDSWMQVHYPGAEPTALGSYVIEEDEGKGALVGDATNSPYIYGRYTLRDLEGTIDDFTDAETAKQLGLYDSTCYYGPAVWAHKDSAMSAGVDEAISSMRVGGRKKIIIPGWLNTNERFSTAEEYISNATGESSIYEIHIVDIIKDIVAWEVDSVKNYVNRHFPGTDSTRFGYYYKRLADATDTTSFETGEEVYFNYTGRLLNGQVFDTTIKDTAKRYGIYNPATTYEPAYMTWGEKYTDLKMGSSSSAVIDGFGYTVFNMKKGEKGTAVFYSGLGYSTTGGGARIPGYSPLIFEIEMIGKDE